MPADTERMGFLFWPLDQQGERRVNGEGLCESRKYT